MTLGATDILRFMHEKLGIDGDGLDADSPLFSSGIIDSAGMVELILFVETTAQVEFLPDDITLERLDSIGRILTFVEERHGR